MGKRKKPEPIQYVKCPECGEEQPDMGNNVACEVCGFGPMPRPGAGEGGR